MSGFNLDEIINSVKSLINPIPPVPKAAESDPVGFRFAEVGRFLKEIGEANVKQAELIAKANTMLAALYKDYADSKQGAAALANPPAATTATPVEKTEEKK